MVKVVMAMILLLGTVGYATAQQERKYIREGNDLFEQQDFEKAEVEYRKAADKKADSFEAAFNMADALYKQKNMRRRWSNSQLWQSRRKIRNGWEKFIII